MLESESQVNISAENLCIEDHQVFDKEFFQNPLASPSKPDLNSSSYLDNHNREFAQFPIRYNNSLTWHTVTGPGFCGATHPGAGKVLNLFQNGANIISNDDCLYVNPSERIFAISDAPERSTYARRLLTHIDRNLSDGCRDLQDIINTADRTIGADDHATLSLLHIPCEQTVHQLKAWAFIAGDTLLFHGNRFNQKLVHMNGTQHFIGRSHGRCEPQVVDLVNGDFFVIASDGISDVRANGDETINQSLRNLIDVDDLYGSTLAIMQECNRTVMGSRFRADSYGLGFDNVSVFLVYPEDLSDCVHNETALLGGWQKALGR